VHAVQRNHTRTRNHAHAPALSGASRCSRRSTHCLPSGGSARSSAAHVHREPYSASTLAAGSDAR
jgi:hypothetical protein